MPISAATAPLKSQISTALKMQRSASPATIATMIAGAIAGVAPMGLMPMGITAIPLIPSGLSATKSQIQNALKMERAAKPNMIAQVLSIAISTLCPIVPPAGISVCKSQITSAFKMDRAAKPDAIAQILSQAAVTYFQAGGTL